MAVSGSGRGIQIIVGADYNGRDLARAQRDLDKLKREAAGTSGAMGKFGAGMKNAVTPGFAAMGAAVAAAGAALAAFAVQLGVDAVRAAAEEEQALARLNTALENVGQGFALPQAKQFVEDLQAQTGVADDELFPALQKLVTATGDLGEAQGLLSLAMDVSAGTGKDLTSVTGALAKASNGSTTALRRLTDGAIDPAVLATGDLNAITGELTRLYGGQAEANANTFAGTMARLARAAEELQEAFGEGFIAALSDTGDFTGDISKAMKDAEPAMRDFGAASADLVTIITDLSPLLDDFIGMVKGAGTAFAGALALFPPLTGIVAGLAGPLLDAAGVIEKVGDETANATEPAFNYGAAAKEAARQTQGLSDAASDAVEDLEDLNEMLKTISAEFSFRDAMDQAKVAVSQFTGIVDESTAGGREFMDSLLGMAQEAGEAALATDDLRERSLIADQAIGILSDALGTVQMSQSAKDDLLAAFGELTSSIGLSKDEVARLQAEMDGLRDKDITITVTTYRVDAGDYVGTPPPGGYTGATGGMVRGPGSSTSDSIPARLSNGEFVIRAASVKRFGAQFFQALNAGVMPSSMRSAPAMTSRGQSAAGLVIQTLNVTSAPAERAEESVPRALRRAAFLAGMAA